MAPHILETPRTDTGDQTRFGIGAGDVDFTTQTSVPSPSKEENDLLRQIRGMHDPGSRTPRSRIPFSSRNNLVTKKEFTPLLRSATKNRSKQAAAQHHSVDGNLQTPAGLKASYGSRNSPALPLNSSVIAEDFTASSGLGDIRDGTPMPFPVSSSSALSTPMAGFQSKAEGPLEHGRNLATLRDQEARLEAIDKENFSLKLKIHFLEEALRRNGKDFNEAALKENTELKVDKVTLQRDLKHYRKHLAQAEKDLEEYRRQLLEYAEKVKRRHASEELQTELDELRHTLEEKEAVIKQLRDDLQSDEGQDANLERMQDDIQDLQAELREKDRLLDEKDEELQSLKDQAQTSSGDEQRLQELEQDVADKDDLIHSLEDALHSAELESKRLMDQKDRELEEKDDELKDLEEQLRSLGADHSQDAKTLKTTLQSRDKEIAQLNDKLMEDSYAKDEVIKELRLEIEVLRGEINSNGNEDHEMQALKDTIEDLNVDIRALENQADDRNEELQNMKEENNTLRQQLHQIHPQADMELVDAKDRIHELEGMQERQLKELQSLRDAGNDAGIDSEAALTAANNRLREAIESKELEEAKRQEVEQDLTRVEDELNQLRLRQENHQAELVSQKDLWDSKNKALESQVSRAEEQAKSLQETLNGLQETGETGTNREMELKHILESERERFSDREKSLKAELAEAREEADSHRQKVAIAGSETSTVRDELMKSENTCKNLEEQTRRLRKELDSLQSKLQDNIDRLEREVSQSNKYAADLKDQMEDLQMELRQTQAECDDLKDELEVLLQESHLATTDAKAARTSNEELDQLREELGELQSELNKIETERNATQRQCSNLQTQAHKLRRENERSLQDAIAAHELEVQSLNDELAAAQTKQRDFQTAKENADRSVTRLRSTIAQLEKDLTAARVNNTSKDASFEERKDLHEMLKDAKIEAEDLATKLAHRDSSIREGAQREMDLQAQLKRCREEMSSESGRANLVSLELRRLQDEQEQLLDQLAELESAKRQVRFPRTSGSESNEGSTLKKLEVRHAAELRGLAKQIEYLSARCRREERFRYDLSFVKTYFTKQVEMYGKCNMADMGLVKAMGIPTDKVLSEKAFEERLRAGTVERLAGGLRPSLKCVGLMVLASVRMKSNAAKWQAVRKTHLSLLKKLDGMRKDRHGTRRHSTNDPNSKSGNSTRPTKQTSSRRALEEVVNR